MSNKKLGYNVDGLIMDCPFCGSKTTLEKDQKGDVIDIICVDDNCLGNSQIAGVVTRDKDLGEALVNIGFKKGGL